MQKIVMALVLLVVGTKRENGKIREDGYTQHIGKGGASLQRMKANIQCYLLYGCKLK